MNIITIITIIPSKFTQNSDLKAVPQQIIINIKLSNKISHLLKQYMLYYSEVIFGLPQKCRILKILILEVYGEESFQLG